MEGKEGREGGRLRQEWKGYEREKKNTDERKKILGIAKGGGKGEGSKENIDVIKEGGRKEGNKQRGKKYEVGDGW